METTEKATIVGRNVMSGETLDEIEFDSYSISEQAVILQEKLIKSNDFYRRFFSFSSNTQPIMDYIELLKKAGMDIGKGKCLYGFRMPLPQKGDINRDLIIFRR